MKCVVVTALFILCVYGATLDVTVGTTSVLYTTWPTFVSFNFDWWSKSNPGWDNAGLLHIDLTNHDLLYLTSQLAPARLRIGGSLGDTIIYTMGDLHLPCTNGISCFNSTRWDEVNAFVKSTGIGVVFGLNELYNDRKSGEKWNTSNAEVLLQYTAQKGYPVFGFEIGNELNGKLSPADCAADAATLKQLLTKYWPDASTRPKVIAPDDNINEQWFNSYVSLSAGHVDIYTYHEYNGYGLDPNLPNEIPTTQFIDKSTSSASVMMNIVDKYAPKADLWLGEGAAAWHSGQDGTTNTFESGFYYVNALGTQAQHKHTGSQRQALVGGYYELIDKTTFFPNPDYYTALLWKRTMGEKVLSTKYELSQDIRVYAHCTAKSSSGSVTLAVVNVSKNITYTINPTGIDSVSPRQEYILTSPNGNIRSRSIDLNDKQLDYSTVKLPTLDPKVVDSGSLEVPPLSYGYIVFPNANAAACH